MPAALVRLALQDRPSDLYCPACGAPVLEDDSVVEECCDHVRFAIDAEGELTLAEPESFAGEDRKRQEEVLELVEETESWEDFLARAVKVLPASVLVLELAAPAEDGEASGALVVVGFDLAEPELAEE